MKIKCFYLIVGVVVLLLASCGRTITEEEAKKVVLDGENDRLPLVVQSLSDVESIIIDSMRIRVKDEPMSGYIYTTWEYTVTTSYYPKKRVEKRKKNIIVEVDSIRQSEGHQGYIEWLTRWDEAYKVIIFDMY